MRSAMYSARAWIVQVGFTAPAVTKMLPSMMNRFRTSCATAPLVDDRARRIGPHPRGAHQMPAGRPQRRVDEAAPGPGRGQRLLGARGAEVEHPAAVLAQPILDLRRRDAVAVGELRIEGHAVVLFRKVLADRDQPGHPVDHLAVRRW